MSAAIRSFMRLGPVKAATGFSRSWIYEAIKRGDFPSPIKIGARAVAWDSAAIAEWQAKRMKAVAKV